MSQNIPQQQYVAQPVMVVPAPQHNALAIVGFLMALVGLVVPTGLVALIGLILSLAAVGRAPRTFAVLGILLGLIGTIGWLVIMIGAIVAAAAGFVAFALMTAGAVLLTRPEVVELTTDMASVASAVAGQVDAGGAVPADVDGLDLRVSQTIDPWGSTYRLVVQDAEPGFDIVSDGPDRIADSDDDVRLTRIDRLWEATFADFEGMMNDFERTMNRLETLDHRGHRPSAVQGDRIREIIRRSLREHAPHGRFGASIDREIEAALEGAVIELDAADRDAEDGVIEFDAPDAPDAPATPEAPTAPEAPAPSDH